MEPTGRRPRRPAAALLVLGVAGCTPAADDPHAVVVATPWPPAARAAALADVAAWAGDAPAVRWVAVDPRRLDAALDRRGGVDLIMGGSPDAHRRLADAGRLDPIDRADPAPWRHTLRPPTPGGSPADADPRVDPAAFAAARATLDAEGWARGHEALARRPVGGSTVAPNTASRSRPPEAVALLRDARHPDGARRLLEAWARVGLAAPAPPEADLDARADGLLADLLGAILVDAAPERRDALRALDQFGHPAVAEAAVGQLPPWPPASVTKLLDDPARASLLDALVAQVAPDPAARAWLRASWDRPRRPVDAALLRDIAAAADGRLAREPRFRAWLRAEWGAWTRQLYRRVARLAGGYRPQ